MANEQNMPEVKLDKELNLRNDFTPPTLDEWKKVVEKDLKGASYEKKLVTKTYEGINLQPIYTSEDLKKLPLADEKPGFGSYVRGTKASGYVGGSWNVSQEIPYADAEEFNKTLLKDLQRGQDSINVKLDTATQLGLDADYAETEKVGDKGLSISALRSITRAFKGVDLTKHPLYVQAGFSALPFMSILNAYLKNENVKAADVKGSVEADPLAYLAEHGELPVSFDAAMCEMKAVTEWVKENAPELKTVGVSTSVYHNAGASAVQELAFALATAVEYLTALTEKGMSPDDAAGKIKFNFSVGTFYFMEISKLRAARVLWSKVLEQYGVSEENRKMFIHAKTSDYTKSVYDPYVNMLRTTTEAFSAVVGGVDSLHTSPFDTAIGMSDEFSRRIARNVQTILKEESHLDQLIDPAGGSYYVESLTNEVAKKAWELFLEVEEKGGMLEVLKAGYPTAVINEVVAARNKNIQKRKEAIVGINMYANMQEKKIAPRKFDNAEFQKKRAEYLQAFRTSGNSEKNNSILAKLQQLADKASEGAIDTATEALLEGATLGEVSKSLRANAGDAVKVEKLNVHRVTELFENLRDVSLAYKEKNGHAPKVFLANMGTLKQFKARADFSRGFFEAGGFEVIYPNGFDKVEDAAKAAAEAGAKAAVLCSTDDAYVEYVAPFVKALKNTDKDAVAILAGYPKDQIETYKEAGMDDFIFLGADVYSILSGLLKKLGAM